MPLLPDSLNILHLLAFHLWSGPADPTANLVLAQRQVGLNSALCWDTVHGPTQCEEPIAPRMAELGLLPSGDLALSPKAGPWQQVADFFRLRQLAKNYQIIHCHMSHDHNLANLAVGRSGPKLVRTIHAARSFSTSWGRARALRQADGLIVCADSHKEWLTRCLGIADNKIAVIRPGLDVDYWSRPVPPTAVDTLGLPEGPKVALVAMMQHDRGHREVLSSWPGVLAHVPTAKLIIVGEGEAMPLFQRQAAELGITASVHFTGYLMREQLRALYQAVDLTVLVNTGNDLAARAMGEAGAAGKATVVVAADDEYTSLRRAALLDGARRISPALVADSAKNLGATIGTILAADDLCRTLGAKARQEYLTTRTIAAEEQQTRDFYKSLLEQ